MKEVTAHGSLDAFRVAQKDFTAGEFESESKSEDRATHRTEWYLLVCVCV